MLILKKEVNINNLIEYLLFYKIINNKNNKYKDKTMSNEYDALGAIGVNKSELSFEKQYATASFKMMINNVGKENLEDLKGLLISLYEQLLAKDELLKVWMKTGQIGEEFTYLPPEETINHFFNKENSNDSDEYLS